MVSTEQCLALGGKFCVHVSSGTELFGTRVILLLLNVCCHAFIPWRFGGTWADSWAGFWEGVCEACALLAPETWQASTSEQPVLSLPYSCRGGSWPRVAGWADVFNRSHNPGVSLRDLIFKIWPQIQNRFLKCPAGLTDRTEGGFGPQTPAMSEGRSTVLREERWAGR